MSKEKAAVTIQHFLQSKRVYSGLSGNNNYDYYLLLLTLSDNHDPFTQLAKMMYGRVVATPQAGFPFLKQLNPYLGEDPSYHRNDVRGSSLTSIILKQWQVREDEDYLYIPVVHTQLGTIEDALRALDWRLNKDYQLIDPPEKVFHAQHLKFIKIAKNTQQDLVFTTNNRWGRLSSLGIIASPWILSKIAIDGGFKPEAREHTLLKSTPNLIKQAIERQPKTMDALKKSDIVKKLSQLKEKSSSDASLLAESLYSIINNLPSDINAPDIIARLSLFMETALLMHHDDHARFANFMSAIIHEVSLLLLKHSEMQKSLLIDVTEYQSITATEMDQWIGMCHHPEYQFVALPAHSGSHANFIASKLARDIGYKEGDKPHTVRRAGGEYWEMMDGSRTYTVFGKLVKGPHVDIVRLSAGPIGDYFAGTYPAIDINKLIRQEVLKNNQLKTLVIDITSASYDHLKLAPDLHQMIAEKGISLVFWESCQKFGLLHTDQAQYGRVFAYCHKNNVSPAYIESLQGKVASYMHLPDIQIAAFIKKSSGNRMPKIREKHFANGLIFRKILSEDNYRGINKSCSYELRVDTEKDPFFYLPSQFNEQEIEKIDYFFKKQNLDRCSFGHRYTTQEGGRRIAAGAESEIDASIFAMSLKHYIRLSPKEIYQNIIENSKNLELFNREQLSNYLSLIKAWLVCLEPCMPITAMIAYQLGSIIMHSDTLKKNVLSGSQQFLSDIYAVLEINSPFKAMIQEASEKNNPFAIKLFEVFDDTYKKTGKYSINNAIKKTLLTMDDQSLNLKIPQETLLKHTQALMLGEYSQTAATFLLPPIFKECLDIIERKRLIFLNNHQMSAAVATFELHQALTKAGKIYFLKDNPSAADYMQFKKDCLEAIDSARTILQSHRGWTHFLLKLGLGIISLGIIPAALAIRSKKNQGTWRFRLFETESSHQLNALSRQIDQMQGLGDPPKIKRI